MPDKYLRITAGTDQVIRAVNKARGLPGGGLAGQATQSLTSRKLQDAEVLASSGVGARRWVSGSTASAEMVRPLL